MEVPLSLYYSMESDASCLSGANCFRQTTAKWLLCPFVFLPVTHTTLCPSVFLARTLGSEPRPERLPGLWVWYRRSPRQPVSDAVALIPSHRSQIMYKAVTNWIKLAWRPLSDVIVLSIDIHKLSTNPKIANAALHAVMDFLASTFTLGAVICYISSL